MSLVMRYAATALLLLSLPACARQARQPTAEERAERLNESKAHAAELMEAGSYPAALSILEPLAVEASADHQVFVMLGDAYARVDEFDKAVKSYETAIRLSYTSHASHLKLATLLMSRERTGRALTEFELAIRFGDSNPLTHYNYGLALRAMGRPADALEQWRLAHEMSPRDPRYAEAVGIGLAGVDDEQAVAYFEEARALGADGPSFHNNFGLALAGAGRHAQARGEFELAVATRPAEEAYRFNLAASCMRSEDYERAAAEWELLIEAGGERWSYAVYLAKAYQALGRHRDALAALAPIAAAHDAGSLAPERVDRIPPRLDEAFEALARSYRADGDAAQALASMRRAVELAPGNLVYLNNYGVMLAENGMLAEAKSQWRKVLEIDENDATARENLFRFGP